MQRVTRVLFYCCLKRWLMNYLSEHESVKVASLLDPYSLMHILHIYKYTSTHKSPTHRKAQPFSRTGKPLNIESTWSWAGCGETRSKHSYRTTYIRARRGYTPRKASLISCLRPQENNQRTIYYSANARLYGETVDRNSFSEWDQRTERQNNISKETLVSSAF